MIFLFYQEQTTVEGKEEDKNKTLAETENNKEGTEGHEKENEETSITTEGKKVQTTDDNNKTQPEQTDGTLRAGITTLRNKPGNRLILSLISFKFRVI